jgi:hypothetical protein
MRGYWNRIAILSCLACTMVFGCLRTAPADGPIADPVVQRIEAIRNRAELAADRAETLMSTANLRAHGHRSTD